MNYVFDTNVLIYIIKKHPSIIQLEKDIEESKNSNFRIISIVTKAEIESPALQRQWAQKPSGKFAKK